MSEPGCLSECAVQLIPPSISLHICLIAFQILPPFSIPYPLGTKLTFTPWAAAKHDSTSHPFTSLSPSPCHTPHSHKPHESLHHLSQLCSPPLHLASLCVSNSYLQLHERAIFSISCEKWKCSAGAKAVFVGEVSHWGPRCVFSQLHCSNRPDAPQGDESASVAVSQHCYYFTLHERRTKEEEEEGEVVTHRACKENHNSSVNYRSSSADKQKIPQNFRSKCADLLPYLEQYRIMPVYDWLSDRFCQPQHIR